jgi:hypothetical protein
LSGSNARSLASPSAQRALANAQKYQQTQEEQQCLASVAILPVDVGARRIVSFRDGNANAILSG